MGRTSKNGVSQLRSISSSSYSDSGLEQLLRTGCTTLQHFKTLDESMQLMKRHCESAVEISPYRQRHQPVETTDQQFEITKKQCIDLIDLYASKPSAGTLRCSLSELPALSDPKPMVSDEEQLSFIELNIPNIAGVATGLNTSLETVRHMDHDNFLSRIQLSRGVRLNQNATVQGVRINSRFPHDASRMPCLAVNSLSDLTGISASVVGNASFSKQAARDTNIPVQAGDLIINGVVIDSCDGTVDSLISRIGESCQDHGVLAEQLSDGILVLESLSGRAIEVRVSSQAVAHLCGFSMGRTSVRARTQGVLVWISDEQENLEFDSEATSFALNGCPSSEIGLSSFGLDDLNCQEPAMAQFSCLVLERLTSLFQRQCEMLKKQLHRIIELIAQTTAQSTDCLADSCTEVVRQLETTLTGQGMLPVSVPE